MLKSTWIHFARSPARVLITVADLSPVSFWILLELPAPRRDPEIEINSDEGNLRGILFVRTNASRSVSTRLKPRETPSAESSRGELFQILMNFATIVNLVPAVTRRSTVLTRTTYGKLAWLNFRNRLRETCYAARTCLRNDGISTNRFLLWIGTFKTSFAHIDLSRVLKKEMISVEVQGTLAWQQCRLNQVGIANKSLRYVYRLGVYIFYTDFR